MIESTANAMKPFALVESGFAEIPDLNLKDAERCFIVLALKRTKNNKTRAAELLGMNRKTLLEKMRLYKLEETSDP